MGPLPNESGGYRNDPAGTPAAPADAPPQLPPPPELPPGEIDVDTDVVRHAAAGFADEARTAASLVGTLAETLDNNSAGGDPWGDDSLGTAFAAGYVPARDSGLRALHDLQTLLASVGDRLSANAANHETTEAVNLGLVDTLRRGTE